MLALGLMSGTSLDGVDAALLRTDGETVEALGASISVPYAAGERALLRRALADAAGLTHRDQRPGCLAEAEALVTDAHAAACRALLRTTGLAPGDLGVVGFHGQTVLHRPEARLTVQLGDGAALARILGASVAWDFRAADVAAGGQGAPLVPAFHAALARGQDDLPRPLAVLNLGGVANVTYLDGDAAPIAWDTGPGNALLDDLMFARTGRAMDEDGATAARGRPDEGVLAGLLSSPFFREPPPKSLDRNAFTADAVAGLAIEDAAATLAAFTARAVAATVLDLPRAPALWVACGGGARNPTLLRLIGEAVATRIVTADSLGWSADAMEAQAFGFLGVRSLAGKPLSYPGTTGVSAPTTGGRISRP